MNRLPDDMIELLLGVKSQAAFIASDIGGGNILEALSRNSKGKVGLFFSGVSAVVIPHIVNLEINFLDRFLRNGATSVITGTSSNPSNELYGIQLAKELNIPTFSFLDHWLDYKKRFILGRTCILPDVVLTGDPYAFRIAKSELKNIPVFFFPNPYIVEQLRVITEYENNQLESEEINALILTEPAGDYALGKRTNEFKGYTAVEAVFSALDYLSNRFQDKLKVVVVRLHPSEKRSDYANLDVKHYPIIWSKESSLALDIARANVVTGAHSMGLYISALSGRETISIIPEGGIPCTIPASTIKKIFYRRLA